MLAGSIHTQKRCPVSVLAKVVKIVIRSPPLSLHAL